MNSNSKLHLLTDSPTMGERAAADLRFIRSVMAGSGRFTAVPGRGGVFMGWVALVSGLVASKAETPGAWVAIWIAGACIAFVGGAWSLLQKAREQDVPLTSGVGRKFLLGLCPSLIAGIVMTSILWQLNASQWLPVAWLMLYGSAILSAGALSVPVVPITGAAFMLLGLGALAAPESWSHELLLLGFCGLHILSGTWIAVRHGG